MLCMRNNIKETTILVMARPVPSPAPDSSGGRASA